MPKVSVVIPTRNRAALLRRAIASVLSQTNGDFEVVVTDDASTDDTKRVVCSFQDSRVKYLAHPINQGVSIARNTAIMSATGEYIAFLDDDDEWLPEKLEYQLERMNAVGREVGVICCGHYEVDSVSKRVCAEVKPSLRGQIFEQLFTRGFFNHTSTVMVRAECFQKVGMFDPSIRYGEDFDMWLRLARVCEFDFVPQSLVRLYFQASGLTQSCAAIISGWETHVAKYRELFDQHPRVFSERLHQLGTYYCLLGDADKGKQMFQAAVARNPLSLKNYVSLALSHTGSTGVRTCYSVRNTVSHWLAELTAWSPMRRQG